MGNIEIEFWEIPLYVSVIVLLCVTVLYLIKERTDRNKSVLKVYTKGKFRGFNEEIHSQLVKLHAEKALQDSERKYQDLYDNAPDMFVSVDAKTATVHQCFNFPSRARNLHLLRSI